MTNCIGSCIIMKCFAIAANTKQDLRYGLLVKWLRRRPLTAKTGVRLSYGSPEQRSSAAAGLLFSSPPLPQAVDCAPLNAGEAGQVSHSAKPPGGCFGDPLSAVGGLAVSFVGNSKACASPLFAYPIWHTVPRRMLRPHFDFASAFSIVAANARG